jgi:putative Mg2+ transporter-C (MgtC) family protein
VFGDGEPVFIIGETDQITRVVLRLVAAALLGAVLGWNRERKGKAAGLRTHTLVALGAALFMLAAREAGIPTQYVIQGVAAGVGFIGAGAIFKQQDAYHVEGLTTAATVWITAAVGLSAGLGWLWPALVATLLALAALFLLGRLERHLDGAGRPGDDDKGEAAEKKQR